MGSIQFVFITFIKKIVSQLIQFKFYFHEIVFKIKKLYNFIYKERCFVELSRWINFRLNVNASIMNFITDTETEWSIWRLSQQQKTKLVFFASKYFGQCKTILISVSIFKALKMTLIFILTFITKTILRIWIKKSFVKTLSSNFHF